MPRPPTRRVGRGPAGLDESEGVGSTLAAIDREALAAGRLVARGRAAFGDPGHHRAGVAVLRRLRPLLDGLPEDLQRGSPDIAWGRLGTVTKLAEQRPERLTGDLVWRTLARDLPGVPRAAGLWQARHFQAAERKTISRRLTLSRARGR